MRNRVSEGRTQVQNNKDGKVYIILVNYNGSADTIACLESLQNLSYENCQVLIVDNRSTDDSVSRIKQWLSAGSRPNGRPVHHEAEQPRADSGESRVSFYELDKDSSRQRQWPHVLIENERNCGFSGGNNVAIRFALREQDGDYFWLLNNDTVVDPDSLVEMVAMFKSERAETPEVGMCGSLVLDFESRNRIQAYGGARINRILGVTRNCHKGVLAGNEMTSHGAVMPDYISGCSLLVSREAVDRIGLLNESYFLYWEDAEWSFRCKQHGLALAVAGRSKVWHRRGSTSRRYPVVGFYNTRNSLRFFRDYLPRYLVFCIFFKPLVAFAVAAKHRDLEFFRESMRGYLEFFRRPGSSPIAS